MTEKTTESMHRHFLVEKELADRLRSSNQSERPSLVPELYQELYRRVPDHPRTVRAKSQVALSRVLASQMRLVRPFLDPAKAMIEFGAGDGAFAASVQSSLSRVVAAEVCIQGGSQTKEGSSLEWVYYDGLTLPLESGQFDLAFSYQVLEHVHPEDVAGHLAEAARVLKPGGVYLLATPHAYSGPHDVSRHFTDHLETFHLKEWTYRELVQEMRRVGFSRFGGYLRGRYRGKWGFRAWKVAEVIVSILPVPLRRRVTRMFLTDVIIAATR